MRASLFHGTYQRYFSTSPYSVGCSLIGSSRVEVLRWRQASCTLLESARRQLERRLPCESAKNVAPYLQAGAGDHVRPVQRGHLRLPRAQRREVEGQVLGHLRGVPAPYRRSCFGDRRSEGRFRKLPATRRAITADGRCFVTFRCFSTQRRYARGR